MKKILAITLALLMLLLAITACTDGNEKDPSKDTNKPADTEDNSDSGSDSDSDSDTDTEDNQKETVTIFEKGKTNEYVIVYADDYAENSTLTTAISGITYYARVIFDVPFIASDREFAEFDYGVEEYEIIIGNCVRRPESAETQKLLTGAENEFAIKLFDNGKLAIVGSNVASVKSAIDYLINTYMNNGQNPTSFKLEKGFFYYEKLPDTAGPKWVLDVPKYSGGSLANNAYNTGADDKLMSSRTAGNMHIIYDTNLEEFNAYITKLKGDGYSELSKKEYNGNVYVQLKKDGPLIYTYYLAKFNEVRVMEDYASATEAEFEYTYTAKAGENTVYYQYAMMRSPTGDGNGLHCDNRYGNNGAFDIIKLADNKLILIDGGWEPQTTDKATEALMEFLREITGTPEGEKITVAAWYLTHVHNDHRFFINKLLEKYSDEIIFERMMCNIPSSSVMGYGSEWSNLASALKKNNPDILFMKLHTGQNITLGNINLDVLMTHEDAVDPTTGKTFIIDGNNACPVIKFNINGKSVMYFGDWGGNDQSDDSKRAEFEKMQSRLLDVYEVNGTYPIMKADILQVAHHSINDWLSKVYRAVDPDYAFFSQADVAYNSLGHECFKNVIKILRNTGVADENMYFAGRKTHWLTIAQDGTMTHDEKALQGADEGYYYYVDANGAILYEDKDGKVSTDSTGTMITDSTGTRTFTEITGAKAVRYKGYWELLENFDAWNSVK